MNCPIRGACRVFRQRTISLPLWSGLLALILVALLGAAAALAAVRPVTEAPSQVLAQVNDAEITAAEFRTALEQRAGVQIMDEMINELLIRQAAREQELEPSDGAVDAQVQEMAELWGGQAALEAAVARYNMTMDEFRAQLELQLLLDELCRQGIELTDADVQQYYDENQDRFEGRTLEDVRPEIREALLQERSRAAAEVMDELRREARLEIHWAGYPQDPPEA